MEKNIDKLLSEHKIDDLVFIMNNDLDWVNQLDAAEALAILLDPRGQEYLVTSIRSNNPIIRDTARQILLGLNKDEYKATAEVTNLEETDISLEGTEVTELDNKEKEMDKEHENEGKQVPSTYSKNSYSALQGIASLCSVLGWLILFLSGLGVVVGIVFLAGANKPTGGIILASSASGGFLYIILRVIAESIFVILDIENNTRQSAENTKKAVKILAKHFK